MTEKPIAFGSLLPIVEQVMRICIETLARSEALESLLIDKGLVTKAELDVRTQEREKINQKLSDAVGSSGGES